ncbi:MAG: Xaa-Pro dipeptidase [Alphaproteobacteria bacterium]|jgi:Xaa-Pro aminopeptidase|nr:Xaa-Pro dipeptidase [Alphaproteobacteria bacterium]
MNFHDRLAAICRRMKEQKLDLLVGLHDGGHFIEKPNSVMVISGFKSLGAAAVMLRPDGESRLVVAPSWDAERAAECCPVARVSGTDNVAEELLTLIRREALPTQSIGVAGLRALPSQIAVRIASALPDAQFADAIVFDAARTKTDEEIANAREAAHIAERGYQRLIEITRPGMSEDELASELKLFMKSLGADDNFLMLCANPHNRAVQPSTGRRLQYGDILLAEITPSVRGQLAQICRTVVLGLPPNELRHKYQLVVDAMNAGIAAAVPGTTMSAVCAAINAVLEAQGYGEYCRPPHIRRRGHGLGFGSVRPGDVALDNMTVLEPDMLFMIHPNQYLPETGYLLCGEPVVMTANGAEPLTAKKASLAWVTA